MAFRPIRKGFLRGAFKTALRAMTRFENSVLPWFGYGDRFQADNQELGSCGRGVRVDDPAAGGTIGSQPEGLGGSTFSRHPRGWPRLSLRLPWAGLFETP